MKKKCPKCGKPMEYVECIEDGIGWWKDGYACTKCDYTIAKLHVN